MRVVCAQVGKSTDFYEKKVEGRCVSANKIEGETQVVRHPVIGHGKLMCEPEPGIQTMFQVFKNSVKKYPNREITIALTGSGALKVAEVLQIPFVQEVVKKIYLDLFFYFPLQIFLL